MKRFGKLFISYVVPLILVGLLVGTVVFSTLLNTKRTVEYDYLSDAESVKKNPEIIRVAAEKDYAPYSFYDEKNIPSGHDIELIYQIARDEGYNISLTMTTWSDAKKGLDEGKYDVLLTADYTRNSGQEFCSSPINSDPYVFFGKKETELPKNISELKKYRIAALLGESASEVFLEPTGLSDSVIYFDTTTEAFRSVDEGRADFVIGSLLSGRHTISTNGLDMESKGNNLFENSMSFMVSKNNAELLNKINRQILAYQSSGYLSELNHKWFEDYQPDMTFGALISQNKTLFILLGAILLLVLYTLTFTLSQYSKQKEKKLSETSVSTGLPNLNSFRRIAGEIINDNPDTHYTIARIDIDHFKFYNDVFGTEKGDYLLRRIGEDAEKLVRDSQKEILVGHSSGDQFVLMMKTSDFSPIRIYNTILKELKEIDPNYNFELRIGYCKVEDLSVDVSIYCDWVYLALKSIKGDYVRHWVEYDKSMRQHILEEREIGDEMDKALADGQFVPYFQPQYNYQTNSISGAEVLVRWLHPQKGLISPGKFIPVFERNGFIYELDKYIWRQACIFLNKAEKEGINLPCLSVNISRRDMYREDLIAVLNSLCREYSINKRKLHLEITESAYTENPELMIKVVKDLSNDGFVVEMDDFGSGYSSLSILKDLPFDIVKLDMMFLKTSQADGKTGNILSSMVHMAHQIDLSVIAEGVETVEQAKYLHSIGCYHMQGYLFAKPMNEKSFVEYLSNASFEKSDDRHLSRPLDTSIDFLDDRTQSALLFNSFIGSACLMEIQGTHINILRVNERFFEELGLVDNADFDLLQDLSSRLDDESLNKFNQMTREAIETGNEVTGSLYMKPMSEAYPDGIWVFVRARFLAKKVDSYLFFCSIENVTKERLLSLKNETILNELNNVIANLPGGIARFVYDDKICFEFMSRGFALLRGYTVDELTEKLNEDITADVHPDDKQRISKIIDAKKKSVGEFNLIYRVMKKDNTIIWLNTRGLTEKCDNRYTTYLYCTDISDEKAVEEKLKSKELTMSIIMSSLSGGTASFLFDGKSLKLLEMSDNVAELVSKTTQEFKQIIEKNPEALVYEQDLEKVINAFVNGSNTGKDTDISFRILRENEDPMWMRMHCNFEKKNDGTVIHCIFTDMSSVSELYNSVINETDTGIIVIDKNTHETVFANRAGAAIFNTVPEKLIGMQCYNYCWGKDVHCKLWTENLPEEGLIIDDDYNGRHYRIRRKAISWNGIDAIITYYSDRTATYSTEEQFKNLVSNMPCGVSVLENDGSKFVRSYVSDAGEKILNANSEDGIALTSNPLEDISFIHSDDYPEYIQTLRKAWLDNEPFNIELRIHDRQNKQKWIELKGQPVFVKEDQKQYLFITFNDITGRKSVERELRLRESEYRAVAMHSKKMMCKYITSNHALVVSEEVAQRFDFVTYMENAPEEFIKLGYIGEDSKDRWINMFKSIDCGALSGEAKNLSISKLSTHEFRIYDAVFSAIQVEHGKTAIAVLSFEDVTEERNQDKNRKLAYNSVLQALSSIYQASVVCNTTRNVYTVLENKNNMSQFVPDEGEYDELTAKIAKRIPDDSQRELFSKLFSAETLNSAWKSGKDSVTLEHKQLYDNGEIHWIETTAFKVAVEDDEENNHIIVFQSIDERKRKETELNTKLNQSQASLSMREQEKSIADSISEAGTFICTYDIPNRVLSVPNWYAERFNIEKELTDFPNMSDEKMHGRFIDDDQRDKYFQLFKDICNGKTTSGTEIGLKNKNGETVWEKIRTAIIHDRNGNRVKAILAIEDITDSHNAEEKNRNEMKRLQALIAATITEDIRYLGLINLKSREYVLYTNENNDSCMLPLRADYDKVTLDYSKRFIQEDEQEQFFSSMKLSRVSFELENKESYSYEYSTHGGREKATFRWYDDTHNEIVMVVRDVHHRYLNEQQISAQNFIKNEIERLEQEKDIRKGLYNMIKSLGEYTDSDRAYVISADNEYLDSNIEWRADGVSKKEDEFERILLKSKEYANQFFVSDTSIYIKDIENIKTTWPYEYGILKEQGVKSFIIFAIKIKDNLVALLGLDNPEQEQSELLNSMLFMIGRIVAEKLYSEYKTNELEEQIERQQDSSNIISALSSMNYATWMIDLDDNLLVPINDPDYSEVFGGKYDVYGKARESIDVLINNFVEDEDEKNVREFFDFDRLREYLKSHEFDAVEYKGKKQGWTRVIAVPTADDNEKTRIIISFTRISTEKQKMAEADKKLKDAISKLKIADMDKRKDYLTNLFNRLDLDEVISNPESGISAAFMMDIDNFKEYNDKYGHVAGDECLRKIGTSLSEYGSRNNIRFFRYGGEEFLGLAFDQNASAEKTAEDLLDVVRNLKIETSETEYGIVTVSMGYTTETKDYRQMIKNADDALYKAKSIGKNTAVDYAALQ